MTQTKDTVKGNHTEYIDITERAHTEPGCCLETGSLLMDTGQPLLRQVVGKLNWVVQGSRPYMAFEMLAYKLESWNSERPC